MISRRLSLAPLSLPDLGAAAFLRSCAAAGYRHAALRLIGGDPTHPPEDMPPLVRDAAELREVRAILDGEGLAVSEVEVVTIAPHTDICASRPMLEAASALGARHLVVCVDDPDMERAAAQLAAMDELAAEHGLLVELEFLPYTALQTIEAADKLVRRAGGQSIGILVDALHLTRSGGDAAAVAGVARSRLRCLQLCDAPRIAPADIVREARSCRMIPGMGELDLAALIGAMPADAAICIEVPNIDRQAAMGAVAYAIEVRKAAERLLENVEKEPA